MHWKLSLADMAILNRIISRNTKARVALTEGKAT